MRYLILFLLFTISCGNLFKSSEDKTKVDTKATIDEYLSKTKLLDENKKFGAVVGQILVDKDVNLAIPASAIPASAIPASAIPASAIPASAIPASMIDPAERFNLLELEKFPVKFLLQEESSDKKPVPGAKVTLKDKDGILLASTIADQQGIYAFKEVAEGAYSVEGFAEDKEGNTFAVKKEHIEVVGGNIVNLSDLTLAKTGAIKGFVKLDENEELLGVDVYIPGTSFTSKTDDNGFYIILFIPEGSYKLVFEKDGYARTEKKEIQVVSAETTTLEAVTLKPSTGSCSGAVGLNLSSDFSGIIITLIGKSESGKELSETIKTKEDGKFSFDSVKVGNYELTFEKEGYLKESIKNVIIKDGKVYDADITLLDPIKLLGLELKIPERISIGQPLTVELWVKNNGKKDVFNVSAEITADEDSLELVSGPTPESVNKIKPDEEKKFVFKYETKNLENGEISFLPASDAVYDLSKQVISGVAVEPTILIVETKADISVSSIKLEESVLVGQKGVAIDIELENKGEANFIIDRIDFVDEGGKIIFSATEDFPLTLSGKDTNIFTIKTDSILSGESKVFASIKGKDANYGEFVTEIKKSEASTSTLFKRWFETKSFKSLLGMNESDPSPAPNNYFTTVSWFDYDKDGKIDLMLGGQQVFLLKNKGDGTFEDKSSNFFLCPGNNYSYFSYFDYNNDGYEDIIISHCIEYNPEYTEDLVNRYSRFYLLKNNQNGGFEDQSSFESSYPFGGLYYSEGVTSIADFNRDNNLDFFISAGDYTKKDYNDGSGPVSYYILGTVVRNNGDATFLDVGSDLNMFGQDPNGKWYAGGFDSIWFDFNNDQYPELFFCDIHSDQLSRFFKNNDGSDMIDLTYDISQSSAFNCFTSAAADYDNDGFYDFFIGSVNNNDDKLFRNVAGKNFKNMTEEAGISRKEGAANGSGYCAQWLDYDNDSDLDLLEITSTGKDFLFVNKGDGTFANQGSLLGLSESIGTGCAFADYDKDGDVDVLVNQNGLLPFLLKNNSAEFKINNYLRVAPFTDSDGDATEVEKTDDRPAIGATILVDLDGDGDFKADKTSNDFINMQQLGFGAVYQNEPVAHFGLGKRTEVDVKVLFPDGSEVLKTNVKANQLLYVEDTQN